MRLVNDFTTMEKARQWWGRRKKAACILGTAVLLCAASVPSWQDDPVQNALEKGDADALLQLLRGGLDPKTEVCTSYDTPNWAGWFPLSLLPYWTLPKVCDRTSPLIVETVRNMKGVGGQKVVAELLRRGVDVNRVSQGNTQMETPLYVALDSQNADMARFLLVHGANPNDGLITFGCDSPFQYSAQNADPALLRLLIQHSLQTQGADEVHNALYSSSSAGQIETVRYLLSIGQNPNQSLADGRRPLMGAAQSGRYRLVQLLLQKGGKAKCAR